jgi:two-component system, OmpR family, response regulator ChvI
MRKRILIVDDDRDILFTFKSCLEGVGWEVTCYDESLTALYKFKPGYYDRLLIDIRMPNLNGFELVDRLRIMEKDLKVCFVTAFEGYYWTLREIYPTLDAKCFVNKPISCADLMNHLMKYH